MKLPLAREFQLSTLISLDLFHHEYFIPVSRIKATSGGALAREKVCPSLMLYNRDLILRKCEQKRKHSN